MLESFLDPGTFSFLLVVHFHDMFGVVVLYEFVESFD
jgi:hypothetical protein